MAPPAAARILVTAGPTHEPIDAVRYLGNRSSGRMGIALAEAAAARGMPTTLLLGPTALQPPDPSQITTIRFQTTADLQRLLAELWPRHDVLIMAAAVADYRPARVVTGAPPFSPGEKDEMKVKQAPEATKLRRRSTPITLELQPTPDLLAEAAHIRRPDQFIIGFALEPAETLLDSARDKLMRKSIDAIVANPLETIDSDTITATLLLVDGCALNPQPGMSKTVFAAWLMDELIRLRADGRCPR